MEKIWLEATRELAKKDIRGIHNTMVSFLKHCCQTSSKYFKKNKVLNSQDINELTKLNEFIRRFLLVCHNSWPKDTHPNEVTPSYEDICAGLCSLLLDIYTICSVHKTDINLNSTLSTIYIIFECSPSYIMDAALQSSTFKSNYVDVWDSLCRKLFIDQSRESKKYSMIYLKYILVLMKWKLISPKEHKDFVKYLAHATVPPPSFLPWLKSILADHLKELNSVKTNKKMIKLMMKNVKYSFINSIVEMLAAKDSNENNNSANKSNEVLNDELFFIDNSTADCPEPDSFFIDSLPSESNDKQLKGIEKIDGSLPVIGENSETKEDVFQRLIGTDISTSEVECEQNTSNIQTSCISPRKKRKYDSSLKSEIPTAIKKAPKPNSTPEKTAEDLVQRSYSLRTRSSKK